MFKTKFCIFGLTGGPVHKGHLASYLRLVALGYHVIVVCAVGHEFKPKAIVTFPERSRYCRKLFGKGWLPLEEMILGVEPMCEDIGAIREALGKRNRPVMAIDMLRALRALFADPTQEMVEQFGLDLSNPPTAEDIFFAIGPDVDVGIWTGIEEIRAEGFQFERLPEVTENERSIRSTLIRNNIVQGLPWEHMVPEELVEDVRNYGWK